MKTRTKKSRIANGPAAPELIQGGEWFNSSPLLLSELRGKVVLVDFWTYSCINCQRTFPYLNAWWNKYKDNGFVIIGAHSPEFEFEKDPENVKQAIADFGLKYPVMQDNNFATWRAYKNRYWPAKYLIDKNGGVRYTHFGEGDYDETEKMIQLLLSEISDAKITTDIVENEEYRIYSRTPELYLGYGRINYLASPEKIIEDLVQKYSKPASLKPNYFAYEGNWVIAHEFSVPSAGSKLYVNFDAKEVFLVARPRNGSGTIKVYLDNQLNSTGENSVNGIINVDSDKLYKLIKLDSPGRHELRLEFDGDFIEIYAFTFG